MQKDDGRDLKYDVLIIGDGPAGLSAALQLGRSLRSVLVCDNGEPRNGPATEAHGYLTRDGIPPEELRSLGREEVMKYGGKFRDTKVTDVSRDNNGFTSILDSGETVTSRKVVLAPGVRDNFPDTDVVSAFGAKSSSTSSSIVLTRKLRTWSSWIEPSACRVLDTPSASRHPS